MADENNVSLATELTIAWLSNPSTRVSSDDVPAFLNKMVETLAGLGDTPAAAVEEETYTPAVTVRKSLASREHIISMLDGKPYKTLRRHLATNGLTPDEYRQRYGLKADYPMVAPAYSEARQAMAKQIGLGRKPGAKVEETAPAAPTPAKRSRKTPSEAKAAAAAHLGTTE